ncbi:hypothetical protein AOR_1_176134 [Paecilomyces variotii No. 5]|uniref:AAA+ ATPase domain-containing protein n=1 Tax=Byssochlamys spectabilis (strain No. 5 / NBRC 109023) TaxID=1356009 RepID=V5I556_BYSSN|nr:hypothetical protein AOR_1_176134 [Paecilomyces variotii No. 5]
MGEGEQRTIHPFFTKNYNSSGHSTNDPASGKEPHVALGDNTSKNANQTAQNEPDNSIHNVHAESDASHCHGYHEIRREQWPLQQVLPAVRPITPQGTTLDEDPNSSRRKRRKTEPLEDLVEVQEGQEERGQPASSSTDSRIAAGTHQHSEQKPGPTILDTVNNTGTSTVLTPVPEKPYISPYPPIDDLSTTSSSITPPKKTLKLNANGKLLSSPPADNTESKGQKKGSGKRKSLPKKKKEQESKVVVMKYGAVAGSKEEMGKLINTILAGEHKHVPRQRLNPPATKEKPQKPTHPFFLGKSARKTEQSPGPPSLQQSAQTGSPSVLDNQAHRLLSDRPQKPFPLFSKSPFAKVPDPVEPVWPPQQFAHVRGLEGATGRQFTGPSDLQSDRRKAKTSVVSIDDSENVLLCRLHNARTSPTAVDRAALRIPKKHVASGVVLQKAMQSQLSDSMPSIVSQVSTPSKRYHPAISRLQLSIPSTMTPFDRGECETLAWTQKYAPVCAEDVLQVGQEAVMLRDWLRRLTISAVDTGKESQKSKQGKGEVGGKRTKRRKRADKLDGFIVSSSDEASEMGEVTDPEEDELAGGVTVNSKRTVIRAGDVQGRPREKTRLTNTILLSGPSGCGKTASVNAVAKELDFEVFEINASSRRSARDIVERVGDMTQNHLVHRLNEREEVASHSDPDIAKQNKVNSFFKTAAPKAKKANEQEKEDEKRATETPPRMSRAQKQSLILLEEADLLFEEDKQFWTGVVTLISQSKRPIIITCNDEKLIPLEDLSLHAILRYRMPPRPLAVDYLLLIAANEGHMLSRDAVMDLYSVTKQDLRRSLTELDFWCQMAVGSEKSGLDWIVDRYPPGRDVDAHGDTVRAISLNTYQRFMGWFNRDAILEKDEPGTEIELVSESQAWWQLSIQDSEEMVDPSSFQLDGELADGNAGLISLESLRRIDDAVEMRSALDILCYRGSLQPNKDYLDTSYPPMTEKQRSNYVEGYQLLQADTMPDYTQLSTSIGSTLDVFTRRLYYGMTSDSEDLTARKVLKKASQVQPPRRSRTELVAAFEPIMRADNVFPAPTGRLAPSFENGMDVIYEDLAPYIRGIVAFDLRLERYRLELSGLPSQGGGSTKRARKTRASRAALEGGDKANTRKERWFPADVQPNRILATGNEEWQKVLVQNGHFNIAPMAPLAVVEERRRSVGSASESSGDGGF